MEKDSYDRIVESATRLFAQKGYHGTSMREIARGVGLHVATVQQHVTSKELLYKEVFRRQYEQEYEIVQQVFQEYQQPGSSLQNADTLKTFLGDVWKQMCARFIESPYLVRLWVYRLLERGEFVLELDKAYSLSLFEIGLRPIEDARQKGIINPDRIMMLLWMSGFAWMQMGFFAGRNLVADLEEADILSPEIMARFFQFIDLYVDRMLDLNPKTT